MADALQAALTQHDKVRRSTDIPLFYGIKGKDTISPHQLLERINRAKRVARWDQDERVCDEFFLCLRGDAIGWTNTLDNKPNFDKNNWADVQKEFLAAYAPKFTARTLCTSFHDLKQKNDETVQAFYNRVSEVFRDAFMSKPAHVTAFDGTAAERYDVTVAQAETLMLRGINSMQLLIMNTMFIGGLREEIRTKVLETGPTRIHETVELAREIEIITGEKKKPERGSYISSITEEGTDPAVAADDSDVLDIDQEDVEHVRKINVIRRRMNKPPLRYKVRPGSGSGGSATRSWNNSAAKDIQCHWCKIKGHFERDCRKRQAAGAPMVGAAGRQTGPRPGPSSQPRSPWSANVNTVNSQYYESPYQQHLQQQQQQQQFPHLN